ncbi:MAG TPA: hypothetical protein VGM79_28670 [Streptosporangiaceae bacterium]
MDPEDGLDTTGRLGHVAGVTLVADGQLDVIAQSGVEALGMAHQQDRTHARLNQHPHHVRSGVAGRSGDSDGHGRSPSGR